MPDIMGGKRKGAVQSQSQSFEELIILLVGSDIELIIVPFQNLFRVGQNGSNVHFARFYAFFVNISVFSDGDDVFPVVEGFRVGIRHSRECLEKEEVEVFVGHYVGGCLSKFD